MCYKMVQAPNLPQNRIKHCLIGRKYTDEIAELESFGITCLQLNENTYLYDEVNCHADILCCNLGNGEILVNNGSIGESELKKIGYNPLFINGIQSPYPKDIPLNCGVINNTFICNEKYTSPFVKEFILKNNYQLIHTNQGYSKCNLCIVNDGAVITEDKGLSSLLKKYQFDVLEISSGDIYLSDKHHGFLGGASGKLSDTEIYFSGDLSAHRDYNRIIGFLTKHKVKAVFNKSRKLTDFGGFIQLTEVL